MKYLRLRQVSPSLIGISESLNSQWNYVMWLAIGAERAVLADTGVGLLPGLRALVDELAGGKPLSCLLTHSDPDHVGGAGLFDSVYLSAEDLPLFSFAYSAATRLQCVTFASNGDEELQEYAAEHLLPPTAVSPLALGHGDRFELGGETLEAFFLPGHTPGSTCFINHREGYALVGDAITKIPLMDYDRCPPLEVYLEHLKAFHKASNGMRLYCGHSFNPLGNQNVRDIIKACEEVLSGKTDGDPADPYYVTYPNQKDDHIVPRIHTCGSITLRYNAARLR